MRNPRGLGFGGFLVGLGVGWIVFTTIDVSSQILAWLIILAGGAIVASTLLSYLSPGFKLTGVTTSLIVGLVIALVSTSGFGALWPGSWNGGDYPYSVEETRDFSGVATAGDLLFKVDNVNGNIEVSTWERAEYEVELTVKARGTSDSDARNNLGKVDTSLDDRLVGGRLELVLTISVPRLTWNRISINIAVTLPADAEVDLDVETTNGEISLAQLKGETLRLRTTNGDLSFDGVEATTITGSTTNGRIRGVAEAEDMTASTTNGGIELSIPSARSGEYDLGTTNGNVKITVTPSDEAGFDLDMRTTSATVTFNLEDLTYEVNTNTHKKAQTEGYDAKPIQISIEASTTNGSVRVDE